MDPDSFDEHSSSHDHTSETGLENLFSFSKTIMILSMRTTIRLIEWPIESRLPGNALLPNAFRWGFKEPHKRRV